MNRLLVLILMAFSISACGRAPVLQLNEYASYVDKFKADAAAHGLDLKIDDLIIRSEPGMDRTIEAECLKSSETPIIKVNVADWKLLSAKQRDMLMKHELGHCVLDLAHNSEVDSKGLPNSVMNPYLLSNEVINAKGPQLVTKLFTVEVNKENLKITQNNR